MNYCVNHPDAAVTAYCQNCGKGLCSACARTAQGNIYCEPCFVAKTEAPPVGSAAPGGYTPVNPGPMPPGYVPPPSAGPSPGLATLLGFIPGVGAMYNGQYIKAIVHVLVFVVLVSMSDRFWFFGVLIGFWVLYQVFDAHQTAKARRDGLPLPDPFGLNELGNRIGGHSSPMPPPVPPPGVPPAGVPPAPGAAPGTPPGAGPVSGFAGQPANPYDWSEQVRQQAHEWGQQAGQWGEYIRARVVSEATQAAQTVHQATGAARWGVPPVPPPPAGWAAPPPPSAGWSQPGAVPPVPPPPPIPPVPPPQWELERARREPIGAIVLIVLGMLFLFNTLGFFSFGWFHHGWPIIIIVLAVWLLARNGPGGMRFVAHFGHKPEETPKPADTTQPGGGK
jgi:TM2 domain-containing membrane protein YozV